MLRGSSPRLYPPSLCLKRKSLQKPTFALVTSESRKSHHIETSPRPHRRALSPCSAHHEAGQCPCRGCDRLEDAANGGCGQRESRWRQRKPDLHYQLGELFFFQAEDGIRVLYVTGVQTCALPI